MLYVNTEVLRAAGKPKIATEIKSNVEFYYAEEYHQQYLAKPGADAIPHIDDYVCLFVCFVFVLFLRFSLS
jgi:peptide methionine sulfoxide reductase MsrA